MKVKTDYVPSAVGYITQGKVYEATEYGNKRANIVNDDGKTTFIHLTCCAHLGGQPWTVVEG